jgi:hypothetical protein
MSARVPISIRLFQLYAILMVIVGFDGFYKTILYDLILPVEEEGYLGPDWIQFAGHTLNLFIYGTVFLRYLSVRSTHSLRRIRLLLTLYLVGIAVLVYLLADPTAARSGILSDAETLTPLQARILFYIFAGAIAFGWIQLLNNLDSTRAYFGIEPRVDQ